MGYEELSRKLFNQEPGPGAEAFYEKMAAEHPYFSLAHFLLLQQTPADHKDRAARAAKAALFFDNPYLLERQLHPEKYIEAIVPPIAPDHEPVGLSEPFETQAAPIAGVSLPKAEELVFEPLYTTDYFASQGIKLSEEQQGTDKLGKQLRSFTDWLKTMKKVHGQPMAESTLPVDITVQRLAEKSNKEDEILTEAMAEAYIVQGKLAKARDVYTKLSLLNPAKSSFFAAKIEQLNDK